VTFVVDASGNPVDPVIDHAYTGRPLDAAAQLHHYRARWYDPAVGRFITEDPAGFVDGPNLYAYVDNNPLTRTDPTGLNYTGVFDSNNTSSSNSLYTGVFDNNNYGSNSTAWSADITDPWINTTYSSSTSYSAPKPVSIPASTIPAFNVTPEISNFALAHAPIVNTHQPQDFIDRQLADYWANDEVQTRERNSGWRYDPGDPLLQPNQEPGVFASAATGLVSTVDAGAALLERAGSNSGIGVIAAWTGAQAQSMRTTSQIAAGVINIRGAIEGVGETYSAYRAKGLSGYDAVNLMANPFTVAAEALEGRSYGGHDLGRKLSGMERAQRGAFAISNTAGLVTGTTLTTRTVGTYAKNVSANVAKQATRVSSFLDENPRFNLTNYVHLDTSTVGTLGGNVRLGYVAPNNTLRGVNHPTVRSRVKIGQEAHRQLKVEGSGEWIPEKTIRLPDGKVVRKDGVGIVDSNRVRIIKPDTPSGRRAAQKRADLMKKHGYDPQVELYDPLDPRFQPGSPTYIGPRNSGK